MARLRVLAVEDFLTVTWKTGALMGTKPEEAFFVRCDRTTMTQNDLDNGRLIWVAPLDFQGAIQWLARRTSPGIVIVDAENPDAPAELRTRAPMRFTRASRSLMPNPRARCRTREMPRPRSFIVQLRRPSS